MHASHDRPLILALDVGTSSCRAGLFDAAGAAVPGTSAQARYLPRTTPEGGAEMDPDRLLEQVCGVMDAALERRRTRGGRIVAVAPTTFWHSLLGVDANGRPLTPVYLWVDARSRADADALRARLDERAVHARTGCVLHWSYWPAKIAWIARTQPLVAARVARWVSFGEYLTEQLFGERAVSVSMASGTGLLDQHTCAWDSGVLDALGFGAERLSPLVGLERSFVGLRGDYAARWPALAGVPWLPPLGDGGTSNVGAGCTTRERAALMVGTSGALRVVWEPEGPFAIPWGTWCYRVDRRRVVMGGALNDGGSLRDWLRRSLRLPAPAEADRAVAALEPDAHGLTVLPFWAGERSPGWAADARGAIVGMRLHTRPEEILRAALEAVALTFGQIEANLRQQVPEIREVVATGGALLHSPAWLQIMADVLGEPVLASAESQASSRGAALLALEQRGLLAQPLESLGPEVSRVYEPVPAHTERYRQAAQRRAWLYELLVRSPLTP